ncbi:MAG: molybdenum cofactor guanylyltransferase [Ilumatobacter sp.]
MSNDHGAAATMRTAGVVLTGGASRRMGRDKALVEVDGVAMADRVSDAMRRCGADPIVLYGGEPAERTALSAPNLPDRFPGEGPLGGVLGAMLDLTAPGDPTGTNDATPITHALIVACDHADVDASTLRSLIDEAAGDAVSSVWVAATDRLHPTCAVWSLAAIDAISAAFAGGERALHRAIRQLRHVAVTVPDRTMANINTPDDLR